MAYSTHTRGGLWCVMVFWKVCGSDQSYAWVTRGFCVWNLFCAPPHLLLGRGAMNEYAISRFIGSHLSGILFRVIRDNGTMNTPFLQNVCQSNYLISRFPWLYACTSSEAAWIYCLEKWTQSKAMVPALAALVNPRSQGKHVWWDYDHKVLDRQEDCGSDTQATGMARCWSTWDTLCASVFPCILWIYLSIKLVLDGYM